MCVVGCNLLACKFDADRVLVVLVQLEAARQVVVDLTIDRPLYPPPRSVIKHLGMHIATRLDEALADIIDIRDAVAAIG